MANIEVARQEIQNDPLARGYSGMTADQILTDLNTAHRVRNRGPIPSHEVIENTVPAEFAALSAAEKQRYQILVSAGEVNLSGTNTRGSFSAMFGPGTTTRSNIIAISTETISRAVELGIAGITVGEIEFSRSL